MLRVHRSNRAERLVDALAEVVRVPPRDPLAVEQIVVQSRGIEQWLAMALSRRLGVWAHARFPFPRHLVESLFDDVLGEDPEGRAAWDEGSLGWAIAAMLPAHLEDPSFAPVASYLAGDAEGGRVLELAERIARVFDDYVVYRPKDVLDWTRGRPRKGDDWQARLFRALGERYGAGHQAARAERFVARLKKPRARVSGLPERVCVFGIATLPPLHLDVLAALGRHVDVHLFVLAPTREYFAHTRLPSGDEALDALGGPPLLASLGRLGREFQQLLEDRSYHEAGGDLFEDAGDDTALRALQSDLLHLRTPGVDAPARVLADDDRSVSVHACHGPMREVEVLHDQLVDALEDPSLEPSDIVVMAPDLEAYAPYVDAVFGVHHGRRTLPYRIVRAGADATDEVATAFDAVLDVLAGRLSASSVLDLLDLDLVRRRFDIAPGELETVRDWIVASGIRWAADAEHRAEVGQPPVDDNTWRFGLDRMLLGVATAGDGETLFGGRLPADLAEGGAALLVGKLADFCARLFELRDRARGRRTVVAWRALLDDLLDRMILAGPAVTPELERLRAALLDLETRAEHAGFGQAIDLATMRRRVRALLDLGRSARGYLSGGVTFCGLVPMRAVPFRVVCLIGMNDEVFPRRSPALGFDRIAADRAPGDRSLREDDRYAFLEALLSAREKLVVTYTGQGIQDNRTIPPSVVVSELLDTMRTSFASGAEDQRPERVVIRHRLHAFSPAYFQRDGDGRYFTYAKHAFDAARALRAERTERPFFQAPLPVEDTGFELTLDELEASLTRPIQTLLTHRLGLSLGRDLVPLDDREPFDVDGLTRWALGSELLERALVGAPLHEHWEVMRASGRLPLGVPGRFEFDELRPVALALAHAARPWLEGAPLDPVDVDLEVGGVRLTGVVRDLRPRGHVRVAYSKLGARIESRHWLRHVALCAALEARPRADVPPESTLVLRREDGRAAVVRFARPERPTEVLRGLIELARIARSTPLPILRNASAAYAARMVDPHSRARNKDETYALAQAASAFTNKDRGDVHDPYVGLVFDRFERARDAAPIGFVEATRRFYEPFYARRSVE